MEILRYDGLKISVEDLAFRGYNHWYKLVGATKSLCPNLQFEFKTKR